jgi:hypothetical protein
MRKSRSAGAGNPQQRQEQRGIDGHGMIRSRHCHACACHEQSRRHERRPEAQAQQRGCQQGPGARQHRGHRGWQHRGRGGWKYRGRQRVSSQCSREPQPNGEAVERADPPIKPVGCCHRAPGQRQRTQAQPLGEQMIEGEGPGALCHIPAEQGSPEQVLVLRRPGGVRQQRQHEHEQRHRPHPQASGQQHRPCNLHNDRGPAGLDELDQVIARQHSRCEERL